MRYARFIPIAAATTLSLIAGSAAALMPSDAAYEYYERKIQLRITDRSQ